MNYKQIDEQFDELWAEFKEKYGDICREEYNPDWIKKGEQKWIYSNKSEEVFDWFYSKLSQAKEKGKREERERVVKLMKSYMNPIFHTDGYNQALSDVLQLLKGEK